MISMDNGTGGMEVQTRKQEMYVWQPECKFTKAGRADSMNGKLLAAIILALSYTSGAWCQKPPEHRENVPIYQVTVTERTVKAVDYQYRQLPTKIDFKGTVLMPH